MKKTFIFLNALVLVTGCLVADQVRYTLNREYRSGRFGYKDCVYTRKNFANDAYPRLRPSDKESDREWALYKAISRLDYCAIRSACDGISYAKQYERIALLPVLEKFDKALGRKLRMNRLGSVFAGLGVIGILAGMRHVFNGNPQKVYGTTQLGVGLAGGTGAAVLGMAGLSAVSNWRGDIKLNAMRILNELLLKGPFIEGADSQDVERVLASIAKKLH